MRSEATENYHLANIVTHYALAHPEIAFKLTSNGREVIRVSPARDLKERAFQIFGSGMLESLLPVSGGREFVAQVSGFVSAPRERRTNRDSQYFFVNHRFVRDKTIAGGLLEGYRSVLPHGVYPVAFLFLDVPLEEIDVNVHPAKTEIRFRRTEAVKDVIAEAVRDALARAGIRPEAVEASSHARPEDLPLRSIPEANPVAETPGFEQHKIDFDRAVSSAEVVPVESIQVAPERDRSADVSPPEPIVRPDGMGQEASFSEVFENAATARAELLREPEFTALGALHTEIGRPALPPVGSAARFVSKTEVGAIRGARIRPIGQLHESFIIAVDDEGLLLIDQHVAHERILFDKFRRKETERGSESQNLLLPETFDLTPAQSQAFQIVEEELASVGFGVMQLSCRTVAIKSIPTDLPASDVRNIFSEILDNVELDKRGGGRSVLRDDIAASLACKAAVKINMPLTQEKMEWMIDRLLTTSSPTTCPHGRPVILRLTMKDIERGFHRT